MELVEWKRWRNRVWHAEVMNRREERFLEACAHIEAIEQEIAFRDVRDGLQRQASARVHGAAMGPLVTLEAYRAARSHLAEIERHIAGLKSRASQAEP